MTVVVGDTGGGVVQTAMNGGFTLFSSTRSSRTGMGRAIVQRLVPTHDGQSTLEIAAAGRSVAHNVLSHPVKPVAPRRLLDEVEVALGSGEQK